MAAGGKAFLIVMIDDASMVNKSTILLLADRRTWSCRKQLPPWGDTHAQHLTEFFSDVTPCRSKLQMSIFTTKTPKIEAASYLETSVTICWITYYTMREADAYGLQTLLRRRLQHDSSICQLSIWKQKATPKRR